MPGPANNSTLLFARADRFSRQGKRKEAIKAYRAVLALPELKSGGDLARELAHWGLAELSIMERDTAEAESHLLAAIGLNPNEANYYQQLGSLYSYMDRFEDAIAQLKKSLDLRPAHPQTMHLLGWAVFMSGDHKSGRQILEQAAALDECDAGILNDLAVCLVEMRLYGEALKHLDRALELDPKNQLLESYRQMVMDKKASL
jgi:tetratricopeptide (TPR) repeat protein